MLVLEIKKELKELKRSLNEGKVIPEHFSNIVNYYTLGINYTLGNTQNDVKSKIELLKIARDLMENCCLIGDEHEWAVRHCTHFAGNLRNFRTANNPNLKEYCDLISSGNFTYETMLGFFDEFLDAMQRCKNENEFRDELWRWQFAIRNLEVTLRDDVAFIYANKEEEKTYASYYN